MNFRLPTFENIITYDNSKFYNLEFWKKAKEHYDAKEYKLSAINVLQYLNSSFLKKKDIKKDRIEIYCKHGLADIEIIVTNTHISVKSKLIKLPKENRKAILRQVAEFNFAFFDFAKIVLDEELLYIDFQTPLALAHPHYLFDVLYEIIYGSDKILSELIFNYNAKPLWEIQRLPKEKEKKVLEEISLIKQEYFELTKHFKENNEDSLEWDIGVISLYKLVLLKHLRGKTFFEIRELLETAYDGDLSVERRAELMYDFFERMDEKKLKDEVFTVELAASDKKYCNSEIAQEFFGDYKDIVDSFYQNGKKLKLSYMITTIMLRFLILYNVDKKNFTFINKTLMRQSKSDTELAYKKLRSAFYKLFQQDIGADNETELLVFSIFIIIVLYYIFK